MVVDWRSCQARLRSAELCILVNGMSQILIDIKFVTHLSTSLYPGLQKKKKKPPSLRIFLPHQHAPFSQTQDSMPAFLLP